MEATYNFGGQTHQIQFKRKDNRLLFQIGDTKGEALVTKCEGQEIQFILNNQNYRLFVSQDGQGHLLVSQGLNQWSLKEKTLDGLAGGAEEEESKENLIKAPIPGRVIKIMVAVGQPVKKGDVLVLLEAMKLETPLAAKIDSVVEEISCAEGENRGAGEVLVRLKALED